MYLVILWIVLFVLEMFVGSMDLWAIGIASLFTALFLAVFPQYAGSRIVIAIVFLISCVICFYILKKIFKFGTRNIASSVNTNEQLIWKTMKVSEVNDKLVIRYEWNFWNTNYEDINIVAWDTVEILGFSDNKFYISKVSDNE